MSQPAATRKRSSANMLYAGRHNYCRQVPAIGKSTDTYVTYSVRKDKYLGGTGKGIRPYACHPWQEACGGTSENQPAGLPLHDGIGAVGLVIRIVMGNGYGHASVATAECHGIYLHHRSRKVNGSDAAANKGILVYEHDSVWDNRTVATRHQPLL